MLFMMLSKSFLKVQQAFRSLRAKAKIKLPEEDGLCRGNNTTQQRRGLCVKSREAEERTGNKEEPRQGILKYRNSRGEGKGV